MGLIAIVTGGQLYDISGWLDDNALWEQSSKDLTNSVTQFNRFDPPVSRRRRRNEEEKKELTCTCNMYLLHPRVDDRHVTSPSTPSRTSLVFTAVAAHAPVVPGGVEAPDGGHGDAGREVSLAGGGVAHVQGGGAKGEGGSLRGGRGDRGATPVRSQLARRVGAVGQRVRNWGGVG